MEIKELEKLLTVITKQTSDIFEISKDLLDDDEIIKGERLLDLKQIKTEMKVLSQNIEIAIKEVSNN